MAKKIAIVIANGKMLPLAGEEDALTEVMSVAIVDNQKQFEAFKAGYDYAIDQKNSTLVE